MRSVFMVRAIVAFVIAMLVAMGAYSVHSEKKPGGFQAAATVPYQPEAQMLMSAIQPGEALNRPERAQADASKNTKLPYDFDSDTCNEHIKSSPRFQCLETYYQGLVNRHGIDVAFSDLKKRYTTDNFTVAQCHPITHVIGRSAALLYPDVSTAYQHGDSFCWSGYFHGVLEGVVKKIGEENLSKEINTICANIPGKASYNFDYYNCVHGLGHGVMELKGDDVPVSLKECNDLTGGWEQQSCYSGVFMENVILFERDGSAPFLKPADPLYPCTEVGEKYKYQCYLGQTSFVLRQNGGNFKKTFEVCAGVEGTYRSVCSQSIGRDAANYANHNGAATKTTCALASSSLDTNDCTIGAVKEFISYYHGTKEAYAYCNLLDEPFKTTCLTTGAEYYKLF